MRFALIVLAILSIVGGFIELPDTLGNHPIFTNFLSSALPPAIAAHGDIHTELVLQIITAVVSLAGIYLAYLFYLRLPRYSESIARTAVGAALHRFWFSGWGFDWLYDKSVVQPYLWIARANKNDFVDLIYDGVVWLNQGLYRMISQTQTGHVRWYATGIVIGAVVTIAIAVCL
jgi:NADH-quinone oxidoreductase subunit L